MKRRDYVRRGASLLPHWRDAEKFGIAKWRRSHPKRYYLMVQSALEKLHIRYWTHVIAWNPYYYTPKLEAGYQTIDLILHIKGMGGIAILFENKNTLDRKHQIEAWESKARLLKERSIPTLILPVHLSSQEYMVMVVSFVRKIEQTKERELPDGHSGDSVVAAGRIVRKQKG